MIGEPAGKALRQLSIHLPKRASEGAQGCGAGGACQGRLVCCIGGTCRLITIPLGEALPEPTHDVGAVSADTGAGEL